MESKKYPISRVTGQLVRRDSGKWPSRPESAPSPETEGTLEWTAHQIFGGREPLLQHLEALGGEWDPLCRTFRQWERRARLDHQPSPTLNELAIALKLEPTTFWQKVMNSIVALQRTTALLKAAMAAGQVVDAAVAAAMDPEKGGKDRELVLRIAGVIEGGQGVTVNVQQNNFSGKDVEKAKTPLLQFKDTVQQLDELSRDTLEGIVEGELVEEGE